MSKSVDRKKKKKKKKNLPMVGQDGDKPSCKDPEGSRTSRQQAAPACKDYDRARTSRQQAAPACN